MNTSVTRRQFGKATAVAAVGVTAPNPVRRRFLPSDAVRVGFIGVGNRGNQLLDAFAAHSDCEIVAAADVYQPYLERAKQKIDGLATFEDYRQILDQKEIDAIVIATPDHWHALQTVNAVAAGKDVYVEKPLAATIFEGQKMVEAAQKTGRIVQVGLQRRSMGIYQDLHRLLQTDQLGHITVARAYRLNNMFPDGIGRAKPSAVPKGLNWDAWLGPRPKQPYRPNIAPYKFRWWQRFSSQMGNWGVHYFDAIRWLLDEQSPSSVVCIGGNFGVNDDRTIPDTAEAVFELPGGALLVFGQYEASSNPALAWGEIEFRGTQGTLYAASSGYRVLTERGGQFQNSGARATPVEVEPKGRSVDATVDHARDFLDCVKSRRTPRCDVLQGHRSTAFAHLANISLATKARLEWDSETERVKNNPQANDLLHYEYRKGFEFAI